MKLFITNKDRFHDCFPNAKEIHKEAYNELAKALSKNCIPVTLFPGYKEEGVVILDFVTRKGKIYFYEFVTTAS